MFPTCENIFAVVGRFYSFDLSNAFIATSYEALKWNLIEEKKDFFKNPSIYEKDVNKICKESASGAPRKLHFSFRFIISQ